MIGENAMKDSELIQKVHSGNKEADGIYNADTNLFVFSLTDKYELSGKYYKVMAQAL